jgi:hypothetical protein
MPHNSFQVELPEVWVQFASTALSTVLGDGSYDKEKVATIADEMYSQYLARFKK